MVDSRPLKSRYLLLIFLFAITLTLVRAELETIPKSHQHQLAARAHRSAKNVQAARAKKEAEEKAAAQKQANDSKEAARAKRAKEAQEAAEAKANARAAAAAARAQKIKKSTYPGVGPAWTGNSKVVQNGKTGVSAMQLAVVGQESVM